MRNYGYLVLSPRGFSNEIEFVVACKTREELEAIKELYFDISKGSKAWRIKAKDIRKNEFVANAQDILEILQEKDEDKSNHLRWSLRDKRNQHNFY